MSHVLSDRWLALSSNQLNPRFEQHYFAVKAKFFSRDPALWPLYRSLEIQPLLQSRRESPVYDHHLFKQLTTREEVPPFSRYQASHLMKWLFMPLSIRKIGTILARSRM